MSNTPTTNFAYNKPAIGDRGWGVTWNANLDSIDSDFAEEHRSVTGQRGKHGPKVTILQTSNNNALVIDHSGATAIGIDINKTAGSGNLVDIDNDGTGNAILITQDGIATAVQLTQNTTGKGLRVSQNGNNYGIEVLKASGDQEAVYASHAGGAAAVHAEMTGGSGSCLRSTIQAGSTANAAFFWNRETTNTNVTLSVLNDSTTSGNCAQVSGAGTGDVLELNANSNAIAIDVNKTNTGNANVIDVLNSGTGTALQITQAGAAASVTIDQNGASTAINVTQNATNNKTLFLRKTGTGAGTVLDIDNTGTGTGINVAQVGDGDGVYIQQTGASRGLYVEKAHTGSSRAVVIDNSGTGAGLNILQNANALALDIDKTNTGSANVIDIDQSGSGYDIEGHGDLWRVDNRGHALFSSTPTKLKNNLNSKNTFSSRARWEQMALSSAQGGAAVDSAFIGATFDGRHVYFVANGSDTFILYDTTQAFTSIDAWEQIAMSSAQGGAALDNAYFFATFDGRYVYYCASDSTTMIRHDTTKAFTAITSWEQVAVSSAQGGTANDDGIRGVTFDGQYVYFAAFSNSSFIQYNTNLPFNDITSWAQIAMSSAQGGTALASAYFGCGSDGRYIYFSSFNSDTMIRYDTTASFTAIASWEQIAMSSAQGATAVDGAYMGITFDGRYIYYTANSSDTFIRFDTTKSFTSISAWQQIAMSSAQGAAALDSAYGGTTFDGRYIYYTPLVSVTVVRFDTTESFTSISSWEQVAVSSAQAGTAVAVNYLGATFDGRYTYFSPHGSDTFIRFLGNNAANLAPVEYAQVSN